MAEPWFVEAFRSAYLEVYPHRDLEAARREARHLVDLGVRGRVLDLCCGFGRHCSALRELGLEAFGLDLSRELSSTSAMEASSHRQVGRSNWPHRCEADLIASTTVPQKV